MTAVRGIGGLIGVDTGGTFTDLVTVAEDGTFQVVKRPSTPPNYAQGIFDVLAGIDNTETLATAEYLCHGTTVATNAMITGTGVRVGLITTAGHRDVLAMMRVTGRTAGRSETELKQYSQLTKPAPIVPKDRIREIDERIAYRGHVVVPLAEDGVRGAVRSLLDAGVEAIAVCFLWSFMNDAHERRARELIEAAIPGLHVSLSSEIAPTIHEYERAATTVVNAHVAPILERYIRELENGLTTRGLAIPLYVMQSVGGIMRSKDIMRRSTNTLGSGPAGGVVACASLGRVLRHQNVICADVGGTSFDVGLVVDGEPVRQSTSIVNQYTLLVPTIDVVSIGAGGGSIARAEFGRLRVGPESAGASPGPVCYGNGGIYPTVTDANVVLGYIDPEYFLGGAIQLDRTRSRSAIEKWVAKPLGLSIEEAAAGIVEIATHHMSDLVRKMSVERGFDPREFVLYAYGGAGPLHGPAIGREIGVSEVVVPLGEAASALSAVGLATSDLIAVARASDPASAPFDPRIVNRRFRELDKQAASEVGDSPGDLSLRRVLELRYRGQVHQVDTPVPGGTLSAQDLDAVIDEFELRYERLYGRGSGFREAGIELETYRVIATRGGGRNVFATRLATPPGSVSTAEARPSRVEDCFWWDAKTRLETEIRFNAQPNAQIRGPAVLRLPTTTILIHDGQRATVDSMQNIRIVTRDEDGQ